jgi:hypothetical protein
MIFTFPCSFIFGVIAPLDLQKFCGLSSCIPFSLVQNLDGNLQIRLIILNGKILELMDNPGRSSKTLLELRYIKTSWIFESAGGSSTLYATPPLLATKWDKAQCT